jgi:hypothetical protein
MADPYDYDQPDDMVGRRANYRPSVLNLAKKPKPLFRVASDRDAAAPRPIDMMERTPYTPSAPEPSRVPISTIRKKGSPAGGNAPVESDLTVPGFQPVQPGIARATDRSNATEAERQQTLAAVQSKLDGLGPLNMASKRRLAGDLLGLRRDLTNDRANQLGQADARITDTDESNAKNAQDAITINSRGKLEADIANAGLDNDAMSRRASAAEKQLEINARRETNAFEQGLKLRADARAERADARAQETQDNAFVSQRDKFDQAQVERATAQGIAAGLDRDTALAQARASLAGDKLRTQQPIESTDAASGVLLRKDAIAETLNRGQGFGSQLLDAFDGTGEGFVINDGKTSGDVLDPSSVEIGKRGGLASLINFISPGQPVDPYFAQAPVDPATGNRPETTLSEEEAERLKREVELFRRNRSQ